jgi:CRP-like cAMP-binding protein
MDDALRQHIIGRLGQDVENLDIVLAAFIPIKARRNQMLLCHGEICKYVYFVASGCLQV